MTSKTTDEQTGIAPVRREIQVSAPVDTAFALFTAHITAWWPLGTHSVYGGRDGPQLRRGVALRTR